MRKEKEKLFYAGLELLSKEEAEILSEKYNSFDDINDSVYIESIYIQLFKELAYKLNEDAKLIDAIKDRYGSYYAQKVKYFSGRLYVFSIRYDLSAANIFDIDPNTDQFVDKYIEAWIENFRNEKEEALKRNLIAPHISGTTVYIYRSLSTNQFLQYQPISCSDDLEAISDSIIYGDIFLVDKDEYVAKEFEKFLQKKYGSLSKQSNGLLYLCNENNFPTLLANAIKFKEYIFLLNDQRYRIGALNILSKKYLTSIEAYYIVNKIKKEEDANLEHVSLKIREAGDLFQNLEDQNIPWSQSMYAYSSIKEILESVDSKEDITLPSVLFMIKLINDNNPRRAVLSVKKIINNLSEVKKDILVIPVIEYLSRLHDYQGFRLNDVLSEYLKYVKLLKQHSDVLDFNDLRVLFPPSLKVALRSMFFRYNMFTRNNLKELVIDGVINIKEEFTLGDYNLRLIDNIDSYNSDFMPTSSYSEFISNYKKTFALYEVSYKDATLGTFVIHNIDDYLTTNKDHYVYHLTNIPIKYHKDRFKELLSTKDFDINNIIKCKSA